MMSRRGLPAVAMALPCAALLTIFLIGVGSVFIHAAASGPDGNASSVRQLLQDDTYRGILLRTHSLALWTATICTVMGYPLAALMVRSTRMAGVLTVVLLLPLFTSIVVRSFGWMLLLGPKGFLNWVLLESGVAAEPWRLMYNFGGVLVGLVHVLMPFAVLTMYPARAAVSSTLIESAAALGANPLQSFWRVMLPLALPGILGSFCVVYLIAVGAIVTPVMLGGVSNETVGSIIYTNMTRYFDFQSGAAFAALLTLSCVAVIAPVYLLERYVTRRIATTS